MARLKDKIILVTGASDGIGKVMAQSYAQQGAILILHGRNGEKLQAVADEIYQITGQMPELIVLDFLSATMQDYQQIYQNLALKFKCLDGVLHNAGILGLREHLIDYPADIWQDVMQVNVQAPLFLTQALLPLLKQSISASVIFTSSGVGRAVRAKWGAYSLSKIATEQICQLLHLENQYDNIRYNCINPGATRTAMRAMAFPDENPDSLVTAEQLVPRYIWLMSDESRDIAGQSIDAQTW